jgi:hypothetical protein
MTENMVKDLEYLKGDEYRWKFLRGLAQRMTSGIVNKGEMKNIWLDYGEILEVFSDLKIAETTVQRCLNDNLLVKDGSLFRFASNYMFKICVGDN